MTEEEKMEGLMRVSRQLTRAIMDCEFAGVPPEVLASLLAAKKCLVEEVRRRASLSESEEARR